MELTVYKTSGEETAKKVVLEDTVFGVSLTTTLYTWT